MPIRNREDAVEVEERIARIFAASSEDRAAAVRGLFVEVLDFNAATGQLDLRAAGRADLPDDADRIAEMDGVHVLLIALPPSDSDRVSKATVDATARVIADQLGDDLLLVFTNPSASQLHIILPNLESPRPVLRRMVVERDLLNRTAVQQVSNIYWNHRTGVSLRAALDEAFNVEPVTRDFFREYKRIFEAVEDSVDGFGSDAEDKRLFVQTLFNRLMFVYFLQRKGWLAFNGDRDYLNALWGSHRADQSVSSFYTDRLEALFFAGLNNSQSIDLNAGNEVLRSRIGDPPFLNGGLFEQTDLDRRKGVSVPDNAIEQILSGLFDRFNFTVMESTPFDIEVAVDPEMLGKVFEELVTGRHNSGAYYTPRPVVSFMCREALKGYLAGQDIGLDAEAIARFVDDRDPSGITHVVARRVSDALDEVKVVDPACGSGAYLLGMMQELVELQTILYSDQLRNDARSLYEMKLHIIQNNLYGVDIDEFAVNIAMLRMWLSLAIDYEGSKPEPLPNLDFKVVRGDSLLGPDPSAGVEVQGALGQDMEQIRRLGRLKGDYMRASVGADKERLKGDIQDTEERIRESLGVVGVAEGAVDWRVEFAEVFSERRGFDIAIANPPYIQLQKDGGRLAILYEDAGYATFTRKGDVYQLFYERGCQLLRPSLGLLAYITSNSWLRAEYGKSQRRYISEKQRPLLLLELGKDVFQSAIVDSGVMLLRAGGRAEAFPAVDMDRVGSGEVPPAPELWGEARPKGDVPWSVLSHDEWSTMDRMRSEGTLLKDWDLKINRGIITGLNEAFIIDGATRDALVAEDPKSVDIIKPILRGRDIQRYRARWADRWLIIAKFGSYKTLPEEFPAIYEHLLVHEDKLRARGQCRYTRSSRNSEESDYPGQHHWLELDNNPSDSFLEGFAKEKLLWIELADSGRFAYDDSGIYGEATSFIMIGVSLKYLCAVLNASLIRWFLQQVAPTSGMGTLRWKKVYIETIPIPIISVDKQQPFVLLIEEILATKDANPDADTTELEEQIDRLVYDLYGLTEEEIEAVERSLGLIHATDEEEDAALSRAIAEGRGAERASKEEVMALLRSPDGA